MKLIYLLIFFSLNLFSTTLSDSDTLYTVKEISKNMLDLKAVIQCADKQALIDAAMNLYRDDRFRAEMVSIAKRFVDNNQGATEATAKIITSQL